MLETRLKLGLADQGRLLSPEEFAGAEFEEPYRYERMGGRLIVMSPSGKAHNRQVWAILKPLSLYDAAYPGTVELVIQEAWIRTRSTHDRLADIAVYLTADGPHPAEQYEMLPGIVFEVVSQGSEERDYVIKRREYYDAGIREYAIVDPIRMVLTVLTYGPQDYVERELKAEDVYTTDQLPGFQLPLSDLPW